MKLGADRSDYSFLIFDGVLCIKDLNQGGLSVTNNIENVVDAIYQQYPAAQNKNMPIIYRDSDLRWDGWSQGTYMFIPLGERDMRRAIQKIKQI